MSSKTNSKPSAADLLAEMQYRARDLFDGLLADRASTLGALKKTVKDVTGGDFLSHIGKLAEALKDIDAETIKGFKFVIDATLENYRDTLKRRKRGKYEVDEFGFDPEFLDMVRPLAAFLFHKWWRVDVSGIKNVANDGPVVLVANHSGVLPFDGAMIAYAIWAGLENQRMVRSLYLDWFQSLPFVQPFLARTGQVYACQENGERLLRGGNAVVVFPEGVKGVGKLFKDRYQLARFGRGGFVRMAIRAGAPIVPVSVVGAEEIYPNLVRVDWLGKFFGAPYLPLTPTFPWFGLLGLIPLPSKWSIHFDKPIRTDKIAKKDASKFLVVNRIARDVRDTIQGRVNKMLIRRKGIFV